MAVSEKDIEILAKGFGPVIKKYVAAEVAQLAARVRLLEKDTHGIAYKGVWSEHRHYAEGSLTTHAGALWVAVIQSRGIKPGDQNQLWRLVCKSHPGGSK